MRRELGFSIGLFASVAAGGGPAVAEDLSETIAPAADWTGFYVGIHGGGGWGRTSFDPAFNSNSPILLDVAPPDASPNGGVFGGQLGYNWQWGPVVGGLEVDFSSADIKESSTFSSSDPVLAGFTFDREAKIEELASARGRLGYLLSSNLLLYGTAGVGWANSRLDTTQFSPDVSVSSTSSSNDFGWVAGAGLEWKLWDHWLLRGEWLHYDFGEHNDIATPNFFFPGFTAPPFATPLNTEATVDVARIALSYKFGAPASVAAGGGPAVAEDLSETIAPAADWTGFYVGIHGGGGWGRTSFDPAFNSNSPILLDVAPPDASPNGGVFGGQLGYNWQWGPVVGGLEVDFSSADIKESSTFSSSDPVLAGFTFDREAKIEELASARGRLGYLLSSNLLLYGTAGVGWANSRLDTTQFSPDVSVSSTSSSNDFGWVAGAGLEWKLWDHWLLRGEWLHYDFGEHNDIATPNFFFPGFTAPPFATPLNTEATVDVARIALSYKFGAPASVAAGGGPAVAEDLSETIAPAADWTGFYVGIHGGGGWGRTSFDPAFNSNSPILLDVAPPDASPNGGVFGGQLGYNWQWGPVVGGLEVDFSSADIKESSTFSSSDPVLAGFTFDREAKIEELASARGRLGYLLSSNLLLYGTAGVGWANSRLDTTQFSQDVSVSSTSSSNDFGWVAGAGLEWKLWDHWLLRGEWLHYDFGEHNDIATPNFFFPGFTAPPFATPLNTEATVDVARIALSYKF